MTRVVSLKMPDDIYLLLKEYARRRNMAVSDIIRRALIKYLKEENIEAKDRPYYCLLYTSPSPRDS